VLNKEFKEEKANIEEKVKENTDVELIVVGKIEGDKTEGSNAEASNTEVEEEKPSILTRITRKVMGMFGVEGANEEEDFENTEEHRK